MGRVLVVYPKPGFLDLVKKVLGGTHEVEAFQDYWVAVHHLADNDAFQVVFCGLDDMDRAGDLFEKVLAKSSRTRLIPIAESQAVVENFRNRWNSGPQRQQRHLSISGAWLPDPCTAGQILGLFAAPDASPATRVEVAGAGSKRSAIVQGEPTLDQSARPNSRSAGQVVDGYRLIRAIGQGGFGTTWLAINEATDRRVAVKFVQGDEQVPQELAALCKYVQVASRSEHLIPVEHINCDDSSLWLVTPLADSLTGGDTPGSYKPLSLANQLQARGHLPEGEAVRIAVCIVHALLTLHQAGLLHGDVAPGNILSIRSRWVLADPGLVRFLGERGICRNQRYYPQPTPTLRSEDLYAIGVVLWEMTSGASEMVTGPDRLRLDGQMLNFLLQSGLPIGKVICRAVAEKPDQRYPTAGEMLQDLRTLAAKLAPAAGSQYALYNLPRLRSLRTDFGLPPLS